VLRTVITVDETRENHLVLRSTAAVEGWRVCIVDTVDELNPKRRQRAASRFSKEPPQQSLFLLLSHAPARVLPTIQSRCRKLPLRPLSTEDVIRAAAKATSRAPDDPALAKRPRHRRERLARADAVGRRRTQASPAPGGASGDVAEGRIRVSSTRSAMRSVPATGWRSRRSSTASIAGVAERLHADEANAKREPAPPCATGGGMGKIVRAARDTQDYNLERKPLVFSVFRHARGSKPARRSCFRLTSINCIRCHKGIVVATRSKKTAKKPRRKPAKRARRKRARTPRAPKPKASKASKGERDLKGEKGAKAKAKRAVKKAGKNRQESGVKNLPGTSKSSDKAPTPKRPRLQSRRSPPRQAQPSKKTKAPKDHFSADAGRAQL